jgi:hypothetical protein
LQIKDLRGFRHRQKLATKKKGKTTMNTPEIQSAKTPNPVAAPPLPEPLAYDIKQAAAALNCCTKSIRRLIQRGYFGPCKALRKVLIPKPQIEAFLKATCDTPKNLR